MQTSVQSERKSTFFTTNSPEKKQPVPQESLYGPSIVGIDETTGKDPLMNAAYG